MKIVKLIFIISFILVFVGCKKDKDLDDGNKCDIPKLKWSHIIEDYDRKAVIDIASQLSESIKANIKRIKVVDQAVLSVNLKASLSKIINKSLNKDVSVSHDFFEAVKKYRTQICVLTQSLDKGKLKSEAAHEIAKLKLIEFSNSFEVFKIIEKTRKAPTIYFGTYYDKESGRNYPDCRKTVSVEKQLNDLKKWLLVHKGEIKRLVLKVNIESSGTSEYNLALAERCGQIVKKWIVTDYNIDKHLIHVFSLGEEQPKTNNVIYGDSIKSLNTYVEFEVQ